MDAVSWRPWLWELRASTCMLTKKKVAQPCQADLVRPGLGRLVRALGGRGGLATIPVRSGDRNAMAVSFDTARPKA